jgi:hypothetical protein
MKIFAKIMGLCSTLILTSCSSFGIDGWWHNSRTVTAKDRMLLVTDKGVETDSDGKVLRDKNGKTIPKRVVCAEPSPDAISALAFSGSLEAILPNNTTAKAQGEMAQTLSELGERTPVIQMLRDSLYRACEAHMNGLMSKDEYNDILAFFDLYSLTLLGIEDLTYSHRNLSTASASTKNNSLSPNLPQPTSDNKVPVSTDVKSILIEYYKAKSALFCMLEMKKRYSKQFSAEQYQQLLNNCRPETKQPN